MPWLKTYAEGTNADGWVHRPTKRHPELRMRYIGYLEHGYTFRFESSNESWNAILGDTVEWATWDASGNLWVAREGVAEKYTHKKQNKTRPDGGTPVLAFRLDLNDLHPPDEK